MQSRVIYSSVKDHFQTVSPLTSSSSAAVAANNKKSTVLVIDKDIVDVIIGDMAVLHLANASASGTPTPPS
jgi:hypothetical protein